MPAYNFPRPTAITFIGRLLMIWGGLWLLAVAQFMVRFGIGDAGWMAWCRLALLALYILCGGLLLVGAKWSRLLYMGVLLPGWIVFSVISIINHVPKLVEDDMSSVPASVILQAIVALIFCALLFSRDANYFFLGRSTLFKKRKSSGANNRYEKNQHRPFDY